MLFWKGAWLKQTTPGERVEEEAANKSRKENERNFYDQVVNTADYYERRSNIYKIAGSANQLFIELVKKMAVSSEVLELGCGCGEKTSATELVEMGAKYIYGVDISQESVNKANQTRPHDLEDKINYQVMDCEQLEFPDNTFDLIYGSGILHHLDLKRVLSEVTRILKPQGDAVFNEPLGHNVLINMYRRMTPGMRTPDEHPLKKKDLLLISEYFNTVRFHYFYYFALIAILFTRFHIYGFILRFLEFLDSVIFALLPFLRKRAWIVIIECYGPKK